MQLSDVKTIKASPETVWAAILNPDVLMQCVPGCQSMTGSVETGFEATVKQKIGPVSATFTGVVTLSDIDPGRAVTISGEGKGGAAGFAKGGAKVTLTPVAEGTELAYSVDASVGGKIAQLGSRLIDGFAKKMADEFFTRFQEALEGPAEWSEEAEAQAEGNDEAPKKGWFKRMIGA
ncbi:MAG: carbon monoxide dehydrogenase subunit G [Alphaproteobacteria bacterium]|nr:carbon monoxide dehydrogenase subunit G [Alphaproteobacteria bacterium]